MNKPRASFFHNFIATPDDQFVREFSEIFGIWLPASNSRWYHHMTSAIKQLLIIDIVKIDDYLAEQDPDYDNIDCRYKDQDKVGMKQYIDLKYGKRGSAMFEYLLKCEFDKPFEYNE